MSSCRVMFRGLKRLVRLFFKYIMDLLLGKIDSKYNSLLYEEMSAAGTLECDLLCDGVFLEETAGDGQIYFPLYELPAGTEGGFIRAHEKSLARAKRKLKDLTRRNQGRNVRKVMENVKVYISGETPDWVTGESPGAQSYSVPSQMKSSHWRDIMTSRLNMSIFTNCTYAIEPPCTERYARWRERSAAQLMGSLLLDFFKGCE